MPPLDPTWAAIGLGLPLVIGAAVGAFAARSAHNTAPAAAWSVGLAAAVMAAAWGTFGGPGSGPLASHDRLAVYVAPLAAGVGVAIAALRGRAGVAWGLRIAAAAAMPAVLLWNQVESAGDPYAAWTIRDATRYLLAIPIATLVLWAGLDRLAARRARTDPGRGDASLILALALSPAVLAGATVAAGSESVGRMHAGLGVAVGGAWLAMLFRRRAARFDGVDTFVLLYAALTAYSRVFAPGMNDAAALAVLLLPLKAWLAELPGVAKLPGWAKAAARPAAVAVLGGAVAGYAYHASTRPASTAGGGEVIGDTGYTDDEAYRGSTDAGDAGDDADDTANPWLELAEQERQADMAATRPGG